MYLPRLRRSLLAYLLSLVGRRLAIGDLLALNSHPNHPPTKK